MREKYLGTSVLPTYGTYPLYDYSRRRNVSILRYDSSSLTGIKGLTRFPATPSLKKFPLPPPKKL